ncbi:pyridoxamine 5'-phosphate oxidase family protein [Quadrisphaera sp. DSM 44207]|uniref:pyridoxamine 5'-phosphate oxidase family protein n=1 Tax=Quadrisphaera sp. DSM 44207 TaxID=1881057 RepID=UPI00088E3E6B|nr:pyridoxamine 5'-phosphate oxidase family protein [Quadrisphaera sp. DSM 44207]SDQ15367.1 General stress protein 26 [Quadrisphaera sp. DSM 44207]
MPEASTVDDPSESVGLLTEKTKDVRFAMMTTIGADGEPHCRPMATTDVGPDGVLWFFTSTDSQKARDVAANPNVGLGYADPGDNLWVSVTGTAELVRDRAKVQELWSAPLKAFFPDGPEDPEVALLRVTPTKGEVWDGPSSAVGRAVAFARTLASGAQTPPGDDVKLEFPGR